jgi:hypothetical protein
MAAVVTRRALRPADQGKRRFWFVIFITALSQVNSARLCDPLAVDHNAVERWTRGGRLRITADERGGWWREVR